MRLLTELAFYRYELSLKSTARKRERFAAEPRNMGGKGIYRARSEVRQSKSCHAKASRKHMREMRPTLDASSRGFRCANIRRLPSSGRWWSLASTASTSGAFSTSGSGSVGRIEPALGRPDHDMTGRRYGDHVAVAVLHVEAAGRDRVVGWHRGLQDSKGITSMEPSGQDCEGLSYGLVCWASAWGWR